MHISHRADGLAQIAFITIERDRYTIGNSYIVYIVLIESHAERACIVKSINTHQAYTLSRIPTSSSYLYKSLKIHLKCIIKYLTNTNQDLFGARA